jgi:tetratricopeptide (TPR) repeat protein
MERGPTGSQVQFRLRLGDLAGEKPPPPDDAEDGTQAPPTDDRETLRLMEGATRAAPHDPDYYYILGETLLRAGRAREALAPCREAVERDPLNPDYRFALGCALWRLGQTQPAERAFRESVQRRPQDVVSLNALGAALVRLDRVPEAVSVLEKALKADRQSADAHANLGVALWGAGDRPGALRCFQRAIRLDSQEPDHHRNLALAQQALGRAPEAVAVLRDMIRRWPTRADLHLDLAEAFHDAGRHDEATRALDEAQRLDPAAIASRPRSREIRDALRLRGVRDEVDREKDPRPGPLTFLLRLPLDLIAFLGSLRPRPRVAGTLTLVAMVALVWVVWGLLPHYITSHLIRDDITIIARAPVRDDAIVLDRIAHAVRRRGLEGNLDPDRCQIDTRPGWRRITCDYAVETALFPGIRHTLRFRVDVEEPYLADPNPKVF